MKLRVCIRIALAALRANKLRSFLTMLGVIIGVASVVTMVSVSEGAQQQIEANIARLGTNTLRAYPGSRGAGGRQSGAGGGLPFSEDDVTAIRQVPGVLAASGSLQGRTQVVAGGLNWSTTIIGADTDFVEAREWPIVRGRGFDEREVRTAAKVAVLGATVARTLFGAEDPIGQRLRVQSVPFKVVGLLEAKGASAGGGDQDDVVLMPTGSARNRVIGKSEVVARHVTSILIKVDPAHEMSTVEALVEELLRRRRKVQPGAPDDFAVDNMAELVSARTATQATLSVLLAGTAAVSLIVGGIGIMNIMLVSVTERTREIGLRLAIGARQRDVLTQFLVEAVTLSLVGGAIGIAFGVGATTAMARFGDWPVLISPGIVGIAALFSAAVGVFFGYYPAQKASRLNPIEALRYD